MESDSASTGKLVLGSLLLLLLIYLTGGCGLTGPSHAAERSAYLDSLNEGHFASALDSLCPRARDGYRNPQKLEAAFDQQVRDLHLTGPWDGLRGDDEYAVTSFEQQDGDYIDLQIRLHVAEGKVMMCPNVKAPLGSPLP